MTDAPAPAPASADAQPPLHRRLGLTDGELGEIEKILERAPAPAELGMYSVMWSEHCSYKSSRAHLGRLPSEGEHVILGPGENAGVVDIGDGLAVVLRIESHNHPSFVEPYQGAATGVGGIIRDILTMGARPIASFDSLRFGRPQGPDARKQRWLARGVVSGISGYGNAVGVPTLGGEIFFDDCYSGNPLVNVMCLGIMPVEQLQLSAAEGVGNLVFLLGAATGRDGIGGVSVLASAGFTEADEEKRPNVQVGDPFAEKRVIEACLELYAQGLTVAVQDLGGAGLSCASSETAAQADLGMRINLDTVILREADMTPVEIFTSESQERMLVVTRPEDRDKVVEICAKWEVPLMEVGEVTAGDRLVGFHQGTVVCDVPAASLADGISYDRPLCRPARLDETERMDPTADLPPLAPQDTSEALLALMGSPNLADASWAWRQYDHQLFLNTVQGPGLDAALLRVKGTEKGLAVSLDGVGRYGRLNPHRGAALAVAEACRNVAVLGARPLAVVDCLNFGNPENPEIMWEFSASVDGIAEACLALDVPVVGGNVSFYNETAGQSIDPTPIVGVVGLLDSLQKRPTGMGFVASGDEIFVVGDTLPDLGASEWAAHVHAYTGGDAPTLDLAHEARLVDFLCALAATDLARSVHDVSLGGVAAALVQSALAGDAGVEVDPAAWAPHLTLSAALFSETSGRAVLSVLPEQAAELDALARVHAVPLHRVGTVTGGQVLGASLTDLAAAVACDL